VHVAPERLGPQPLWAAAAPLSLVAPTVMWVMGMVLRVCALIPPAGLTTRQGLRVLVWVARLKADQSLGR
jgi:hypothetical protein